MFINYVPQQLEDNISNANFTVEEGGHIIGKRYESKTSSHSKKMANLHKTHQSRTKLTTGKAMESHNSKDSLSKYRH